MPSDEDVPPTSSSGDQAPSAPSNETQSPTTPTSEIEVPPKTRTIPQSDWHFAFGPQKWYWVRIGDAWKFVRSNKSVWNNIGIRDPCWVAFKHDTGFLIGGKDEDGEPQIYHSWNDGHLVRADEVDHFVESREAYKHLHDWLDAGQLKDMSVSIGPKGSYFARCGSSWISHGLPKDLMTKLERNKDDFIPVHVALGLHGSWVVLWSDGDLSWNLRSAYPGLGESNALTGAVGQVLFVALNPYEEDGYFVAGKDGCSLNANLPSRQDCDNLQRMTDDYMRMRAKRENATFSYPVKIDGKSQNVYVTPNTYERRAEDSILATWKKKRHLLTQRNNIALVGVGSVAAGVASRLAGVSPFRATGIAAVTGVSAAIAILCDGVRSAQ